MKARRAVVAGFYPPPFAGEPVHVKQLVDLLRERGLVVEVLNLNRHARPSAEYQSSTGRAVLLWKLFSLAGRSSILHLHTNGHSRKSWLLIMVASLAARLRGTSAIVTLHSGLLPGYVGRFGKPRRGLAGWILRGFVRVVCVNEEIRQAIEHLGVAGGDVVVIPAFLGVVPSTDLDPSDRALIREFRPLVVAIAGGEQDQERGLAVLLEAMTQLIRSFPNMGAVLLGWQVGAKTRPLIAELGLTRYAVCAGEVSHDRCLALLRSASVFVRSTFVDGDAITVREALALGVPVVASDTAFRPEGVTLFRKGDVSDLAGKLAQVLATPAGAAQGVRAPADQSARDLWELYSKVAIPALAVTRGAEMRFR